ncbi:hypothetical protein GOBAR_AA27351 [Gossypium barbadense]|uniref:Uncharacterized protein n=1 Tax=Gossypium barbadense TaxID=3634 RepID=A0A2P5WQF4_GOSBA|nr:hypothetical protein GOBAR_AA27351 [Gossypium barbadense]
MVKEPMKIPPAFARVLNQPLPYDDKIFFMPPSPIPQKLKVKVVNNPYAGGTNPRFHLIKGKGKTSI